MDSTSSLLTLSSNLLYEISRYWTDIPIILETVSTDLSSKISTDANYMHSMLEDLYGYDDVRPMTFKQCKTRLSEASCFIDFWALIERKLFRYDVTQGTVYEYNLPAGSLPHKEYFGVAWTNVNRNTIIFSGGNSQYGQYYKETFMYSFKTQALQPRRDMLWTRKGHGMAILDKIVYVFGGYSRHLQMCDVHEAYKICNDKWGKLPSAHRINFGLTTAGVYKGEIFLAGSEFMKIMVYNPYLQTFRDLSTMVGLKAVVPTLKSIILLSKKDGYEITAEGDFLAKFQGHGISQPFNYVRGRTLEYKGKLYFSFVYGSLLALDLYGYNITKVHQFYDDPHDN